MSEVWMVNHYAITPDQPGGTRHYDLGTELVQRGFRVKIFASDVNLSLRRSVKLSPGELYKIETWNGVDFVWVRSAEYEVNNWRRTWNMFSFTGNFLKVANRLRKESRPAVVIGSSPHPFAAVAAERCARRAGAHFLLELRDLWPQALVDMGNVSESSPGVRVMRFIERYLYARAEKFIVLAAGSGKYLAGYGIPPEKVLFLPNGVHLGHFQKREPREAARARYGFTRFTLVYTGAHGPANTLETILRAGNLLRNSPVEFVLVGDGPSKAELRRLAEAESISNVRFLDPIPKDQIPGLLDAADVGVITLKNAKAFAYGVSPNKLFDYMAACKPILCSVPGDMADMVREAQAGLTCVPEDPQSLADAVEALRQLPEADREAMGQRGRDYLAARYNRETLADTLAAALREYAPESPHPETVKRAAL